MPRFHRDMSFIIAVDEVSALPRWSLRTHQNSSGKVDVFLLNYRHIMHPSHLEYALKKKYLISDLTAEKMLNILREVDPEDLELLDVETLMKLFEKQGQEKSSTSCSPSCLQVIWRKLYETYFIKKDVHRNDKLLAYKSGKEKDSKQPKDVARDDGSRLRRRAE